MKNSMLAFVFALMLSFNFVSYADDFSVYEEIYKNAEISNAAKVITYNDFMKIRESGEPYVLVDVLLEESYASGHIEGAINLPVTFLNEETAENVLGKQSKIIVYCGSFQCHASVNAAIRLHELGYAVLDYKGGLKEWTEKGNTLVK